MDDSTTPPRRPSIRVNLMWAHGTEYQYRRGGCRCAMCRRGHNLAQRPWAVAHQAENNVRARQCRSDNPARDAEYRRTFLERHPGYAHHYRQAWVAANRALHATHSRHHRARKCASDGTHTEADVKAQYERQHGKCYWCHEKVGDTYHVDHVMPLVKQGSNGKENLVISCPTCNKSKGAKHPMDFAGVMF